ncbi:Uncharacterised protein [Klebsiella pneumoniae subsp. pneumoniae]|uniref:Uncharacterized protein n=1 Tax=Klebsiella pneumoniae subsp. pneumoniae TaxID=72407 RepID=A0A377ZF64_KLEPN|nr:Uncharacterised protein [Klebsiella pneumoniae subsp. pneumoniae]STW52064.1 Uncharacterised protein [Klebsiella pneumoniae]
MKAHSLSFHWWGSVCKSSECASSCDVYKRTAAPVDAKTRKSTEQQQLVANTKTERREVSRLAIWCHNPC